MNKIDGPSFQICRNRGIIYTTFKTTGIERLFTLFNDTIPTPLPHYGLRNEKTDIID